MQIKARMRTRCAARFIVIELVALWMILLQTVVAATASTGWANSTGRDQNVFTPRVVKTYRRLPSYFIKMIPHFDNSTATEVVANTGKDIFLPCSVRHLGDRTVSWIRRLSSGTLNVLTVGRHTYTMESRIQPIHLDNSESWNLQIRDVRLEDAGVYECQVSTTPKISRLITLRAVESRATIIGGPLLYVNGGSVLRLTCLVDGAPSLLLSTPITPASSWPSISSRSSDQTEFVFWSRNGKLLNYDQDERQRVTLSLPSPTAESNGTKLKTEQTTEGGGGNAGEVGRRRLESRLEIVSVTAGDSGNYTCQPSNSGPDVIQVFVIVHNDSPAAMQDSVMGAASGSSGIDNAGGSQFSASAAAPGQCGLLGYCGVRDHVRLLAVVAAASLLLVKR